MTAARLPYGARWIFVSMPHATFAVAVRDGKVVAAPPIARWAVGKDERVAATAWRELGAVFRDLPEAGQERQRGRSAGSLCRSRTATARQDTESVLTPASRPAGERHALFVLMLDGHELRVLRHMPQSTGPSLSAAIHVAVTRFELAT